MFVTLYTVAFMAAFAFSIILVARCTRPNIFLMLTFVSILIANYGYLSISLSRNVKEALLGTRLTYLGAVFLCFFMFMTIAELCDIRIPKMLIWAMMFANVVMLLIALSMGYSTQYYLDAKLQMVDGNAIIIKDYGPMHGLYFLFLLAYVVGMFLLVAKGIKNKQRVSYKYSYLLLIMVIINVAVYAVRTFMHTDYELITYSYVLSEIILLYIQYRLDLYDPNHVLSSKDDIEQKGVILLDTNLHYMGCNYEARTIMPELSKLNLEYKIPEDNRTLKESLLPLIEEYLEDSSKDLKIVERGEFIYRCEISKYMHKTPDQRRKHLGYLILIHDDTAQQNYIRSLNRYNGELKEKEQQLQELNESLKVAAEEAKRANASKSEFLSRMSHDIRTPMNGIIGMTKIAKDHIQEPTRVTDCMDKICVASNHLLSLVNDILDVSKMESGKFDLTPVPFNVCEMLENIQVVVQENASANQVSMQIDYSNVVHRDIIGSELNVKRVIMNLVSNAVKYNKKDGKVTLLAYEKSIDDTHSNYIFEIIDNGIGMSKEFLEHIFEPFSRENEGIKETASGTGLGMTIVKNLTEQLGGRISVESELGVGSTFIVNIPMEINENPQEETEEESEEDSLDGMSILLVEDNALNQEIATYVLEEAGAEVTTAENGDAAVCTFTHYPPGTFDVILMDIMMPIMDGYMATKEIRGLDRKDAQSIPIIAMTANAFSEDVKKALDAGMNDHLAKPVEAKKMTSTIAKYRRK